MNTPVTAINDQRDFLLVLGDGGCKREKPRKHGLLALKHHVVFRKLQSIFRFIRLRSGNLPLRFHERSATRSLGIALYIPRKHLPIKYTHLARTILLDRYFFKPIQRRSVSIEV